MMVEYGLNQETDAQLVAQILAGDLSAFEMIVERYRAALVARAHAILGSFADADDVAQEAFVRAYFHLHELHDPAALLPWLRRMVERLALMRLRARREQAVAPEDLARIVEAQPVHAQLTDALNVESLLAQLPEAMRETVSLTCIAGYTDREAASILGIKEGTVKSRLNRARAILQEVCGMTERDKAGGQPTGDFTRRTVERLKRAARQRAAAGEFEEASELADTILFEQVKPLYGDPATLGLAKTLLAAFDNGLTPDAETVSMMGLSRMERRRRECAANAAQYGCRLEELDWEVAEVNMLSCTIGRPTGHGADIWGVPVSRLPLCIIDARALCQRLRVSPLTLYTWVKSGCPILRCWPFARFDVDRVQQWLAEQDIREWPTEDAYALERPVRIIFRDVYGGQLTPEQAEEIMETLGYGAWEAPMTTTGGW